MLLDYEGIDFVMKKKRHHKVSHDPVYDMIMREAFEKIREMLFIASTYKNYDDQIETIRFINHAYNEGVRLHVILPVNGGILEKLDRIAEYVA